MGLFNFFNRLDTKNNNGLNLIYDRKTKNLLYAYNKKNGKIEGLLQVFYSVEDSTHNPNYKRNDVGLVNKEFVFKNGSINGYFKEYDSKGNLLYFIENIKSKSFKVILKFSCWKWFMHDKIPDKEGYQINGFFYKYSSDGDYRKDKIIENDKLSWETYYKNGQIKYNPIERKTYYANGQLKEDLVVGREYYEDGAIKKINNDKEFYNNGQIKKDLKSGEEFCENGQLKFDFKNGREYYENGSIKIENNNGAKYYISENLNQENFKDNFSFDCFIKSDSIISNNIMYNYYKNVLIYNESGELYNIEQIVELYYQENYFQRINRIRQEWRDRGGHISITLKKHAGTKYSEPLLINNFCFIVNVEYYSHDYPYHHDYEITTHLNPYTGLFNNIHYENGINSSSINFHTKERESKIENKEKSIAIEFYERGLEKDSNNNYEGAILDYTKALEIDKEFIDAYRNRASVYCTLGNYKEAIEDYTKIIEINPEDIDAYEDRGRAKYSLKNYIGAIEDFDKIIKLDSETKIYSLRGKMKRYLKKYNQALEDYDIAVSKFPNDFSSVFGRGELKFEMEEYQGALTDFNKCIEIKPKLILPFQKIGECRLKIKDYIGAIEDFTFIIENRLEKYKIDGPPSENARKALSTYYHNRGFARSNLKKYKEAISDLKKAIELNPKFEEAKLLLKSLENNFQI